VEARLDDDGRVRRGDSPFPLRAVSGGGRWTERYDEGVTPLLLFGAGHVGCALVLALAPLPFAVRWIDSRADAFPAHVPGNVASFAAPEPPAEIAAAPAGAFVLVVTHDHALDLAITADALARADFPFVGLIGSETKRKRFEKRFRELGIPENRIRQLTCPIGLPSIGGKAPAVIAASAAAQLLQVRTSLANAVPTEQRELKAS
jgi:xanthine dehydrogenase accessory factor